MGFSKIGIVAGTTHPNELKTLRKLLPHTFFLVPGFGAQGATAQNVKFAFINQIGAIINSSRAIIGAWQKQNCNEIDFAKAARLAAEKMKIGFNTHNHPIKHVLCNLFIPNEHKLPHSLHLLLKF